MQITMDKSPKHHFSQGEKWCFSISENCRVRFPRARPESIVSVVVLFPLEALLCIESVATNALDPLLQSIFVKSNFHQIYLMLLNQFLLMSYPRFIMLFLE